MNEFIVSNHIKIPLTEIEFTFARSSGPGGQNVNKVSSKAILRWNPVNSQGLPPAVLGRFLTRFGNRLTTESDLIITSDRFRDQIRNQDDCLEKLRNLLLEVALPPKPRIKTKPSYSTKMKGIQAKKSHAEKKKSRQRPKYDD